MNKFHVLILLISLGCQSQTTKPESLVAENRVEFNAFIAGLEKDYIYLNDKKEIIDCIKKTYSLHVDTISSSFYKVLFYENLLNELYDSHISLNANTKKSYRLRSPVYVVLKNNKFFIKNVFSSQLVNTLSDNVINAEVLSFNSTDIQKVIDAFPTKCHDKNDSKVREWLANKVMAGKRNEPRILNLKLSNGEMMELDIDGLTLKSNTALLTTTIKGNIGIIRINNSLGDKDLKSAFDKALNGLMDTKAIILDLRNTPNGGSTGIAEPMMGRFVSRKEGYQVCENREETYTKFVKPRRRTYDKPLYVLAGRWTGSMGEGMTIGLDGMKRATIIGTEMNRLAGGMKQNKLLHSKFSFSVSFEKMFHLNGSLRETFVPDEYIIQDNVSEDNFMEHAITLINKQ